MFSFGCWLFFGGGAKLARILDLKDFKDRGGPQ